MFYQNKRSTLTILARIRRVFPGYINVSNLLIDIVSIMSKIMIGFF